MIEKEKTKARAGTRGLSRRALLGASGIGVLGSTFIGSSLVGTRALGVPAQDKCDGIAVPPFQKKPVVLPKQGSTDVVEHAKAEMLFWDDIMMEHCLFMALLMPTADLNKARAQALQMQRVFASQIQKLRHGHLDKETLGVAVRTNNTLVQRLVDFKLQIRDLQLNGRIHTLIWPHFLQHVANEGQRFIRRLNDIGRGQIELDGTEVVRFWTSIMGEHAQFISHLLDPQEVELILKSDETAKAFFAAKDSPAKSLEPLADEMVNFKEAAEDGILTGKIRSIILPALADHVRREALKFVDELKRV